MREGGVGPGRAPALAVLVVLLGILTACSPEHQSAKAPDASNPSRGKIEVTRGGVDFRNSPHAPGGKTWVYQINLPFQVAKGKAGTLANLREAQAPGIE